MLQCALSAIIFILFYFGVVMLNVKVTKTECLDALSNAHEEKASFELVESVINDYFAMLEHMKETSLYDVLMYEKNVTKGCLEPLRILTYENENLKKEINKMRKELGLTGKYRLMEE